MMKYIGIILVLIGTTAALSDYEQGVLDGFNLFKLQMTDPDAYNETLAQKNITYLPTIHISTFTSEPGESEQEREPRAPPKCLNR
jgi:hypothetical protein